jgi:hypothetical protein
MRVLIGECAPKALKKFLLDCGQQSCTAQETGWAGKQNGELLNLAESAFDVLITVDANLPYQQNLTGPASPSWFCNPPPTVSITSAKTSRLALQPS